MKNKVESIKNVIDDFEFALESGEVEIGETYPIYGKITDLDRITETSVVLTVNNDIKLTLDLVKDNDIEELKANFFEPAIFISTIDNLDKNINATCSAIVFGKNNSKTIH
ncbi:hypothetical protein UFOVP410_74 [uncultured Caudovirales phage]|uniref:Uncharacterized protein n=1 Tax=uncultured Caudovirales phage TaxID=2100421 RepID=A0A6J5M2S4_9CAUD|nr:hypothetical protein UFOVP410_74 [uncultured Caudovirales phage]